VLDGRLLAFTAVIALGTAMLATVIPALVVARRDFGPLLGAGRIVGSQSRLLLQRTLIGVQVALATLLLIGAGLFVTSLRNVRAIDLGVDVDHLLYVKVDLTSSGKSSDDRASGASATANANAVYMAMLERLRQVPGVVNATVTAGEPLTSGWGISLVRRGAPPLTEGTPVPFGRAVGTDYFATMGTSLRRGRLFTAADHVPGARVAIVDEATAKHFWPNADPLDPCVYLDSDNACTQIVGVVANTVLWEITGDKGQIVYVPLESWPDREVTTLEVRTAGDPSAMVDVVRQAVSSVSPELPWADIRPVAQHLTPQLRSW
jgi:putative ABC transport system permease protein